jgi:hypothetical protein
MHFHLLTAVREVFELTAAVSTVFTAVAYHLAILHGLKMHRARRVAAFGCLSGLLAIVGLLLACAVVGR